MVTTSSVTTSSGSASPSMRWADVYSSSASAVGDDEDGALRRRDLRELRPAARRAHQSLRQVPQRPSHPPALLDRRGAGAAAALSALPAPAARGRLTGACAILC